MGKLFAGWKKAAVWDPQTGDVVQLNTLSTEFSDLPFENIKMETPTGNAFGGRIYPIVIGFMDSFGLQQLESWETNRTAVNIGIYARGTKQVIARQAEQIYLVRGAGVDARTGLSIHRLEYEAIGEKPDVLWKQNIYPGFEFVSSGVWEMVLPITGVTWTIAADFTPTPGDLVVTALNYQGDVVATSTQELFSGRVSTQITAPWHTWKIRVDASDGFADNVSMRADGKTEYTNG